MHRHAHIHDPSTDHDAPTSGPRTRGLAGLSLSMLLSALGTSIANVALPTLTHAFDATFQWVQWVVIAYLVAMTSSIVVVGGLADRIGRRRLLRVGLVLFTAASAAAALAPSLPLLIVARTAQGLGAAAMMALAVAFVGATVPAAKLGRAMGLLGTTSAIGTALGPSLGGLLVDQLGWRSIFAVQIPLGLVAIAAVRSLPADRAPTAEAATAFDRRGTIALGLTLAAYALGVTLGRGDMGVLNVLLLLGAAVGVGVFVHAERTSAAPLIPLALLRDRALGASLVANLWVSTVLMATLVVGPFYLGASLGLGAAEVGVVMSIGPVVAALSSAPAGRLVDRLGAGPMAGVGLGGVAVGSCLLAVVPESLGILGYAVPMVVLTASYATFQAANNTAVMRDAGEQRRGVVSGALGLSRNLGLITGASVMGAVFAAGTGGGDPTAASPTDIAAGMRVTFAVGAVLALAALAIVVGARARARRPSGAVIEPGAAVRR